MVVMVLALDVLALRHDEDAAAGADDFDRRAVEAGQGRRRHHLVDGAEGGVAVAEIEDAIDRAEELVELMGAEEDGQAEFAREPADEVDDDMLLVLVEADQRLVEQEEARAAR